MTFCRRTCLESGQRNARENLFRAKRNYKIPPLLVHCNLKEPPRLVCYASAYGLRAVISHVMESGEEKPLIAFASWTLTASDCNYSQIEKRRCPLCSW